MHVAPLQPNEFRPAYPLIREFLPAVSLAVWLRFARRATAAARRGREGILSARRDGRAHPSGLLCWRCDPDLVAGYVLTAEHVVALDVLNSDAVLDALLQAFSGIAEDLGCGTTRLLVRTTVAPLSARLIADGHRPAASLLAKDLRPLAQPT